MTIITQNDVDQMKAAKRGMTEQAQKALDEVIRQAEWELEIAAMPPAYRSDKITFLIEYQDYHTGGADRKKRLVIFEEGVNSECRSVLDIAETDLAASNEFFMACIERAVDMLRPIEVVQTERSA